MPREYQLTIADRASGANTLVVMPTGLGKTMIAMLVSKLRLKRHPKGKVVVLAPTKPLALQHHDAFVQALKLDGAEAAVISGEVDPGEREVLWRRSRFVFATPETVLNDLRAGRIDLYDTVLLVFDEAHRSVKDYPYPRIASVYRTQGSAQLILGLTASPGGSREQVERITKSLYIKQVEARSEEDEDVRQYVERTKVEEIRLPVPREYSGLLNALEAMYEERVTRLTEGGFLRSAQVTKKTHPLLRSDLIDVSSRKPMTGERLEIRLALLRDSSTPVSESLRHRQVSSCSSCTPCRRAPASSSSAPPRPLCTRS